MKSRSAVRISSKGYRQMERKSKNSTCTTLTFWNRSRSWKKRCCCMITSTMRGSVFSNPNYRDIPGNQAAYSRNRFRGCSSRKGSARTGWRKQAACRISQCCSMNSHDENLSILSSLHSINLINILFFINSHRCELHSNPNAGRFSSSPVLIIPKSCSNPNPLSEKLSIPFNPIIRPTNRRSPSARLWSRCRLCCSRRRKPESFWKRKSPRYTRDP